MNVDELLMVINQQLDLVGRSAITKQDASEKTIVDVVPDSLDMLQIAMALEDASGKPVDVEGLMNRRSVLEALEQIASS